MDLTAQNVREVVLDCLFDDGEPTDGMVTTDGIMNPWAFHPERLEAHRDDVWSMLMKLHPTFRQSVGGGWSFLNGCMLGTDENSVWGEQPTVDQLFVLGQALGMGEYVPHQRELWPALPGGVPYYVVKDVT